MMKILTADVERLVQEEYARASDQHGARFNSAHEAYAVMLEELEEAEHEITTVRGDFKLFWRGVRSDSKDLCKREAAQIYLSAVLGAAEMIQLAAMALKAQKGYGNERK